MGRGGAQLGKAIKGKAKDRKKGEKDGRSKGRVLDVNGNEVADDGLHAELHAMDVKALEEYERLASQAELHRRRMNEVARAEKSIQGIAQATLHRLYRQWRREEKSAEMRWELEVLTQSHTVEVQRKEHWIHNVQQHMDTATTQSASTQTTRQLHCTPQPFTSIERGAGAQPCPRTQPHLRALPR